MSHGGAARFGLGNQWISPSAIPARVAAMLDTLAEGVLVLDNDGRVVLANAAFGSAELTHIVRKHHAWYGEISKDPGASCVP